MANVQADSPAVPHPTPSKRFEIGIAGVLVVLSVAGIVGSRMISVPDESVTIGPRWWPTILSSVSLALSLLLAGVTVVRPPIDRDDIETTTRDGWYRFVATAVLALLFIAAWKYAVSFLVPCAILLAALLWIYGSRRWKPLVFFPIGMTAAIFVLFQLLLKVPL